MTLRLVPFLVLLVFEIPEFPFETILEPIFSIDSDNGQLLLSTHHAINFNDWFRHIALPFPLRALSIPFLTSASRLSLSAFIARFVIVWHPSPPHIPFQYLRHYRPNHMLPNVHRPSHFCDRIKHDTLPQMAFCLERISSLGARRSEAGASTLRDWVGVMIDVCGGDGMV